MVLSKKYIDNDNLGYPYIQLKYLFSLDVFLSSNDANCLRTEESNENLIPDDDDWSTFSFDEQCKFAYGASYKRYNGRYQGNNS